MSLTKDKIPFLDQLPMGWEIKRLKEVANIYLSNVDKKSVEGEDQVKLCNYVDVYYNHTITNEIDFMVATASKEQIKKLTLQKDDVILTKDSESPWDIGIPAWVEADMPGVVCGYHLSLIRPNKEKIDGLYLYYLLSSFGFKEHFWISAKGVTRFGISKGDIQNIQLIIPSLEIQRKLASYLKKHELLSEELILKKNKLIHLLEEKRQSMITEAVTKGLNPNVKMKDSGVDWIGEIPEHWRLSKMKYLGEAITGLTYSPTDLTEESGTIVLRSTNIQKGTISLHNNVYVDMSIPDKLLTQKNDILICSRNGSRNLIGKNALIQEGQEGHSFGAFTTVFRSQYNHFIYYVLNSGFFIAQLGTYLTTTINQLTIGNLNNMEIVMPPEEEQLEIVQYLSEETIRINGLITNIEKQIKLLRDYRQSLIYEAVTGRIDVRDFELAEK